MKIGIVTFPGSLDDVDAQRAVRLAGGEPVARGSFSHSAIAPCGACHPVRSDSRRSSSVVLVSRVSLSASAAIGVEHLLMYSTKILHSSLASITCKARITADVSLSPRLSFFSQA